MKKTPLSKPYAARLNNLNDQLCFAALVTEEANKVINSSASHPATADTASLFPGNIHAPRIHRLATELPEFERLAVSTNCRTALIAASEYLQVYCKYAVHAVAPAFGGPITPEPPGGKDEKLQAHLKVWGAPVVDEIFETVVYLRRRRNKLVHADEQLSPADESYIASAAPRLKAFWSTRPADLGGFDFANRQIDVFSVDDGYAMMNLFRICLHEIDSWVAAVLPLPHVAETVARSILAHSPGLRGDIPRLVRKARSIIMLDYGGTFSPSTLEPLVRMAL